MLSLKNISIEHIEMFFLLPNFFIVTTKAKFFCFWVGFLNENGCIYNRESNDCLYKVYMFKNRIISISKHINLNE